MTRLRLWIVRVLATIGLFFLIVTFTPVLRWWATALAGPWNDPKGDVLIVLGGGQINSGVPDATSVWRTIYGAAAWKEGFRKVVISGKGVALPMEKLLVLHGVPESAVVVENGSSSTRENAVMTAAAVRGMPGRKVLLTSDYHMYRARKCFEKEGLRVEPRPFPDALKRIETPVQRWPVFLDLTTETAKILWYRWQRWI